MRSARSLLRQPPRARGGKVCSVERAPTTCRRAARPLEWRRIRDRRLAGPGFGRRPHSRLARWLRSPASSVQAGSNLSPDASNWTSISEITLPGRRSSRQLLLLGHRMREAGCCQALVMIVSDWSRWSHALGRRADVESVRGGLRRSDGVPSGTKLGDRGADGERSLSSRGPTPADGP